MGECRFPGIKRAALEIALDNGGINRNRSEAQMTRELNDWLERQPQELLQSIDAWLANLTDEELEKACGGEESEMEAFLVARAAPPFTNQLLNDYFDEVC